MPLTPGTRFGTYEVVESLGSGGMGEVYRARDSVLRRDVAVKVLPAGHRLDVDRRARFKREALALATLNHPNIATIHGIEEEAGVQALVMELVDGQTLADRLDRRATNASGLPLPEALAIARQMVDALEAAHQRGIVHRDLKPSNIKIRDDDLVKVLDFGLAKALETADQSAGVGASTISGATANQTILGTLAYMSPEQARGQDVDQRTDIWAFGCVLYEMLTGRRAFEGSTGSDVIAAVLEREPDYGRLPADTPFLVRRLVKRCLEKEPRRRLRDIADARLDLDDAVHLSESAAREVELPRRSRLTRLWPIAIAGVLAAAALWLLAIWLWPPRETVAQPVQTALQVVDARGGTPEDLMPRGPGFGHLYPEFLPNGRTVLFTEEGWTGAFDLVSRRRTDRIIEGVGARYSPDGYLLLTRWGTTTLLAAPFDATRLQVTGAVHPIVEGVDIERTVGIPYLAVSRDGAVTFLPSARTFALVLLEADGRERQVAEHSMLENPRFSPDGRRLVVATVRSPGEPSELWVHDLKSGAPAYRLTFGGGRAPVWSRDGASVTYSHNTGDTRSGIYSKSADGRGEARQIVAVPTFHWLVGWTPDQTLAYGVVEPTPGDRAPASSIVAVAGTQSRRVVGPGRTWGGRLSPDGRWLVYYASDSGYFEIYVTSFPGAGSRSLIAEGTDPAWSPDGSEIYYRSGSRLMAARVDTSSGVRVLSRRLVVEPFIPPLYDDYDIHPDGRTLALVRPAGGLRGREIAILLNWPAELARLKAQ